MNEPVVIGNATLYMGDCRDVLPLLAVPQTIITDPVWPDAAVPLFGSNDPKGMLAAMFDAMPDLPLRVAIQLGCDSDPRFLTAVPSSLRLFRIAWLELVRMGYKGRLGMTGDVGYLFGVPPPAKPGQHIIPGRCTDPDPFGKQANHPCPRKLGHVRWLIKWWSADADVVLDPFMGSGTTGVACVDAGRKFIGIEIERKYFDIACRRIDDAQRQGRLIA